MKKLSILLIAFYCLFLLSLHANIQIVTQGAVRTALSVAGDTVKDTLFGGVKTDFGYLIANEYFHVNDDSIGYTASEQQTIKSLSYLTADFGIDVILSGGPYAIIKKASKVSKTADNYYESGIASKTDSATVKKSTTDSATAKKTNGEEGGTSKQDTVKKSTDDTNYVAPEGGGGITSTITTNNGQTVTFGHGGRHLEDTGLDMTKVNQALANDVSKVQLRVGQEYRGQVVVDGVTIEYRSRGLKSGIVNIGTYYVPQK